MNLTTCFKVLILMIIPVWTNAQARFDVRHLNPVVPVDLRLKSKAVAVNRTPQPLCFVPAFAADELPFFCKIEHQWGKKLPLPVKFRLGSVPYVDWLEGKSDLPGQ